MAWRICLSLAHFGEAVLRVSAFDWQSSHKYFLGVGALAPTLMASKTGASAPEETPAPPLKPSMERVLLL